MTSREDILTALFNLAKASSPFKFSGRRLELQAKSFSYPRLYVISANETYGPRQIATIPPKPIIEAQIWIYTDDGKDPQAAPEIGLNNALDALEKALAPNIVSGVPLGMPSIVSHCYIEGIIQKYPGVLDGLAKAIVPIRILLKGGLNG